MFQQNGGDVTEYTASRFMSPFCVATCMQVCKEWRASFGSNTIWNTHLALIALQRGHNKQQQPSCKKMMMYHRGKFELVHHDNDNDDVCVPKSFFINNANLFNRHAKAKFESQLYTIMKKRYHHCVKSYFDYKFFVDHRGHLFRRVRAWGLVLVFLRRLKAKPSVVTLVRDMVLGSMRNRMRFCGEYIRRMREKQRQHERFTHLFRYIIEREEPRRKLAGLRGSATTLRNKLAVCTCPITLAHLRTLLEAKEQEISRLVHH